MSNCPSIEVSFLGGATTIGASCTLVRVGDTSLVVDCGVRYSGPSALPDLAPLGRDGRRRRAGDPCPHGPFRRPAGDLGSLPRGAGAGHAAYHRPGGDPAARCPAIDERPRTGGRAALVQRAPGRAAPGRLRAGEVPSADSHQGRRSPLAAGIAHPRGRDDPVEDARRHGACSRATTASLPSRPCPHLAAPISRRTW